METQIAKRRRAVSRWFAVPAAAVLFTSACNRMNDSSANYTKAIDHYYSTHPSCLFAEAVQFPVQEDTSDAKDTARYEALVQEGLLVRAGDEESAGEKKVTMVAGKQANDYDLSPEGRSDWVADAKEPGFGNLCYGHRKVVSIDSSTPTTTSEGATTDVVYRYSVKDVPGWAKAGKIEAVFPSLQADLSGHQVGRVTLTDTRKGWQVTNAPWAHIEDSDIYR